MSYNMQDHNQDVPPREVALPNLTVQAYSVWPYALQALFMMYLTSNIAFQYINGILYKRLL